MYDDAAYLRGQALLRLTMAQQISDPILAKGLQDEAVSFTLRAERLEDQTPLAKRAYDPSFWRVM